MRIGIGIRINPHKLNQGAKALNKWKKERRKLHGFWYNLFHGYY